MPVNINILNINSNCDVIFKLNLVLKNNLFGILIFGFNLIILLKN